MSELLHQLIESSARRHPSLPALGFKTQTLDYRSLWNEVQQAAQAFVGLGLKRGERLGIYLEKRLETVIALFAATAAGCVVVPINPILKPRQVGYIMRDCNVRVLVTSKPRAEDLVEEIAGSPDLACVVLVDGSDLGTHEGRASVVDWPSAMAAPSRGAPSRVIDTDMAAILYTSGSTGNPKGVVLSHRNMVAGAKSVSQYLENSPEDRILSVLPLSFDAGLSQLTTGFAVGAKVVLLNYLLPRDVVRACAQEEITGMTGVPPLWIQLAELDWPPATRSMRYFANTGGHMPRATLDRLRAAMPQAKPYLMYGLTEAFRSTYLDPAEVDRRPDSIGKAIPNAEILVVRPDGQLCDADEPGELVHRGALVGMGYWNDPERTAQRYRPAPGQPAGLCLPEIAVWSGDVVRRDADGFLYFVGRRDEMIKTSGYRVSPTEVEEVVYSSGLVGAAAALGIPHERLGQGIALVVTPPVGSRLDEAALMAECRRAMPQYMVPLRIIERGDLPRNPNGKIDRKLLAGEYADLFQEESA
ncbi:MAG TPA: acyl-CoA ligase (AMP-forming), exosortase A system-associated [Stellaceae bacterium]|nr:acyl-CoA ligase (AMP-forming), exosortase A system-associated [Stellaceae bacterium]